ncbi:MAG: hypothetical protein SynsKO_36740 [Synoicihabitans sp.]
MTRPASASPTSQSPRRLFSKVLGGLGLLALLSVVFVAIKQDRQLELFEAQVKMSKMESEALKSALEMESLLGERTVALLKGALQGGQIDAIALLAPQSTENPSPMAVVTWSDDYQVGQWIWLKPQSRKVNLAVTGELEGQASPTTLEVVSFNSTHQVLGLSLPQEAAQLKQIRAEVQGIGNSTLRLELIGKFDR